MGTHEYMWLPTEADNASMETAAESYEKQMFGQVDANGNPTANNEWVNTRMPKDPQAAGWSSNTSQTVSKLSKFGYQVGPNALLKVMAGDNVGTKVDYYYDQPSNNPVGSTLLTSLVNNFANSINVAATTINVHGAATSISNNLQNTTGTGSLQEFLQTQNISTSGTPQAYLNIVFFDENFNFVPLGSTGTRVTSSGNAQSIPMMVSQAPKSGYVFVYVSNESATPVFFDNLELYHTRGRLVEENAYYPYGLKIAALSSKAFDAPKNPYQYQGDYAEFDEESGYNEFELRDYDPQIGRWIQQDPYEEFASPYIGMGNNPINAVDPDGGAIDLLQMGLSAVMNVANNWKKGDNVWKLLGYAAAGAAGSVATQYLDGALEGMGKGWESNSFEEGIAYAGGGLVTGSLNKLINIDAKPKEDEAKKSFLQYWAGGVASIMTGHRLAKEWDNGWSAGEGKKKIGGIDFEKASYVGIENMLTNYSKANPIVDGQEKKTSGWQLLGYFGSGFVGSVVDQFVKNRIVDLKLPSLINIGIGSLTGDLVTNTLNYGVKKNYKFDKLGKAVFFQDILNYKTGVKAIIKTSLFGAAYWSSSVGKTFATSIAIGIIK